MKEGDYTEGYYLHGFGVRLAEAAAEYVNRHMRKELGIDGRRGAALLVGLPGVPGPHAAPIVFDLLPARGSSAWM